MAGVYYRRNIFIATLKNNKGDWIESRGHIRDFLMEEFTKLFQKDNMPSTLSVSDFFQPSILES